jgi:hypothetical protein
MNQFFRCFCINRFGLGPLHYLLSRVSFENSSDSKQPKLEPKLVSALSETKRLFRLFLFYTETESFDVSLNRNKQKTNRNSLIGSIFCFFLTENLGLSRFLWFFTFFSVFFGLFRNSLFRLFRFYTKTESFDVLIEPKQTEDPPKQFKREYVCFGLLRNSSVCFGCFDIGSKHRNKPKYFVFGFTKQTEINPKHLVLVCFGLNRN